jgi:hypothetical protein
VRTSDEALDKLRLAVARQPGTVADAEIFEDEPPFSILKGTAAAQTKELIVMRRRRFNAHHPVLGLAGRAAE